MLMDIVDLLKSLRLLGDPARVRILLLLRKEELSVAELQEILAKGQSQISTHLAQLKQAGLVEDRRTGKNIFYRLAPEEAAESESRTRLLELVASLAEEISEARGDLESLELTLSRRKDRTRTYFDALAGKFGREYLPGRSWQALAEVTLRLLPPITVADLGAGEGTLSQLLAQTAKRVIAVDSSEKMVEFGAKLARDHDLHNLEYRVGDMENLPIGDSEVDLAFFSQSLHHAQHPERAIAEGYRILRPGGRVAVLDLARHHLEEARELYADVWLGFTERELRSFLGKAGFASVHTSIVHRESVPPYFETVCALGTKD